MWTILGSKVAEEGGYLVKKKRKLRTNCGKDCRTIHKATTIGMSRPIMKREITDTVSNIGQ